MASELRVNTLKDARGNNSIATSFVANGSAKAWGHFEGSDATLDDSLNTASLTDSGTGSFRPQFSSNFSNGNFAGSANADVALSTASASGYKLREHATSEVRIQTLENAANSDENETTYVLFGDLA